MFAVFKQPDDDGFKVGAEISICFAAQTASSWLTMAESSGRNQHNE